MLDAFVYLDKIDEPTYTQESARLEDQIAQASKQIEPESPPGEVLDRALDYAHLMLEDLPGYWNQLSYKQRPMFLRAVYPEGLTFARAVLEPPIILASSWFPKMLRRVKKVW